MLDIEFIRQNPKKVKKACKNKGLNPDVVNNLLAQDKKRKKLKQEVDQIRRKRNELNEKLKKSQPEKLIHQQRNLKAKLQDIEPLFKQAQNSFHDLMLQIPNIPLDDVPVGEDESDNVVHKKWGDKPEFDFEPQDHIELGTSLNLLELERGSKVAGFRGYFLKGKGAVMQMALMRYATDKFVKLGFEPIIPPMINRREAFINSGHFPWGESEAYKLDEDETDPENDYFLAGTSEVPLASYYAGETLKEKNLPKKFVGYSPCYRREIGNYGKDTRGFYRVHEFWKVEQFIICKNDLEESKKWHEQMLEYAEKVQQELGLHYRVMLMCTGDMGEPQAKKYDIETWMPGREGYGETASDSIMTDFQSRRANIKYQTSQGTLEYPHMLNNTVLPTTRTLIALWETYQQKDGSILVPESLQKYTGFEKIEPQS